MTQLSTTTRKRGLGRGLGAIFQDSTSGADNTRVNSDSERNSQSANGSVELQTLPITDLHPGQFQPRQVFNEEALSDLALSIRSKGVLEPLIVRQVAGGSFEIIAGERRWRAAQMAQLHDVPVVVRPMDDAEALEIALIENIQREDLSPLEEAKAYEQLITEFSYTQEQLASALGRSRSHVANMMRLLKLPEDVQGLVADGKLTAGHARALLASETPKRLADDIMRRGLNVRQTEKLVANLAKNGGRSRRSNTILPQNKDTDTRAMEVTISDSLGLNVSINHRADGGGELILSYQSLDQLDDLARRLQT